MNTGKKFETQFKKSVPDNCLLYRLKDPPQAQFSIQNNGFSWKNPCDFFLFDTNKRILFCLELKSTKFKSMDFDINGEYENSKTKKMIKYCQIESLNEFANYDNVMSGFIFNFRPKDENDKVQVERTYFQNVKDFISMCSSISKKSFNEIDLINNKAIRINGEKKRKLFVWDIKEFLDIF